ncbi:hypothetical protein SAMN04488107_0042 [Geodermatophilus saharensis]|uniref:Uncharacterized protein n=1 Tax=Geodermatophilus saharensis TaxID=1137994 RepID=A0A238ZEZ7_9ACTN|nr:hypothetical protein [Geodermatophilus saharensis]SNR82066.1 hypothetical protein SAMN04488107_0042 [Geodermatophilus saharensis]
MPARDLELIRSRKRLHTAAISRERVRVRGIVAESGDGYSGTYRNVWLRIQTAVGASVRLTASPSSTLGTMPHGAIVELAARLTGLVDVADNVYYAERAQLLRWEANDEPAAGA